MIENIKVIGFDADDTLWLNEKYYRETEEKFSELLKEFINSDEAVDSLFKTEMKNLRFYGYGAKSFTLSMIETATKIMDGKISAEKISAIIALGKELISKPLVLLPGVKETLELFYDKKYELIVATKGDLLDQERKLKNSGLEKCFHHIEIMSDKKPENYLKLLKRLEIKPEEFAMIGNSLKSDVLPVLEIGGCGIHVPYEMTWQHERVEEPLDKYEKFFRVEKLSDALTLFED